MTPPLATPSDRSMKSTSAEICSRVGGKIARLKSSPNSSSHHGRTLRFCWASLTARSLSALVRGGGGFFRSEEHTSELQSRENLVCRLLLEKKQYLELR